MKLSRLQQAIIPFESIFPTKQERSICYSHAEPPQPTTEPTANLRPCSWTSPLQTLVLTSGPHVLACTVSRPDLPELWPTCLRFHHTFQPHAQLPAHPTRLLASPSGYVLNPHSTLHTYYVYIPYSFLMSTLALLYRTDTHTYLPSLILEVISHAVMWLHIA